MIRPPRTAEIMLESLGARASFREPLLGDLAERFSARAEREGPEAARRWYFREALRAAPHLLNDSRRSLRAPDIRHIAGVVITSYVFTMALAALTLGLTLGVVQALGFIPRSVTRVVILAPPLSVSLVIEIVLTMLAGYIAAWLDSRAPLASAFALGLTWLCAWLAIGWITGGLAHLAGYWIYLPVLLAVGPVAGGALRLRAVARSTV